mmetsp:Transcript_14394/g.33814  ORF Transcript_14394/g.33814 Transcript_14394/m.33814 type:complete len:212 (-) Transcript_14394:16-651(-)
MAVRVLANVQPHACAAAPDLQHQRKGNQHESSQGGVSAEVRSQAQGIDRGAHRQASDDNCKEVQHGPDCESAERQALRKAEARLAHIAAVHATYSKPKQLKRCEDELVLRRSISGLQVQLILEFIHEPLRERGIACQTRVRSPSGGGLRKPPRLPPAPTAAACTRGSQALSICLCSAQVRLQFHSGWQRRGRGWDVQHRLAALLHTTSAPT